MNAHFPTTIDLRVKDPSVIHVGELVYCQPNAANPRPKIEGIACIVAIKDQQFAAHHRLADETSELIWQDVGTITHHLPGYELYQGRVPAGHRDEKLIQLGRWITTLLPLERAMWAEVTDMRGPASMRSRRRPTKRTPATTRPPSATRLRLAALCRC